MTLGSRVRWNTLGGAGSLCCLLGKLSGGILLQAAVGGCTASSSSLAEALGQPFVTGIGTGLSRLVEALVLTLVI